MDYIVKSTLEVHFDQSDLNDGRCPYSLAPDCKPAPILAEHTVWEIQRNGPYSDWHSRFWTRDQGNEQTCCTIGQSAVTNDYLFKIHATSWLIINVAVFERRKQESTASSLTHGIYPKMF